MKELKEPSDNDEAPCEARAFADAARLLATADGRGELIARYGATMETPEEDEDEEGGSYAAAGIARGRCHVEANTATHEHPTIRNTLWLGAARASARALLFARSCQVRPGPGFFSMHA